jgi:LysM repeat protein
LRDRSILARPRLPILGLTAMLAAAVVITILTDGTEARPPVVASAVPQEAFRPWPSLDDSQPPLLDRAVDGGVALPSPSPTQAAVRTTPVARPTPVARTTRAARPSGPVHVVRPGDTVWEIAQRHAADVTTVLRSNTAVDPGRLVAGQRILVPGGGPMTKPTVIKPRAVRTPASPARLATPRLLPLPTTGRHVWPLSVRGTITTTFTRAHPGIDIAAPTGTLVRAVAAGTVIYAGWRDDGGGYVVVLRHPDGMVSTYNHNRALAVERGERVSAGQTIASVGSTGWSTGPHLDVRIEMGGQLINPLRFF